MTHDEAIIEAQELRAKVANISRQANRISNAAQTIVLEKEEAINDLRVHADLLRSVLKDVAAFYSLDKAPDCSCDCLPRRYRYAMMQIAQGREGAYARAVERGRELAHAENQHTFWADDLQQERKRWTQHGKE